jgi:hypothetical protein
VICSSVCLDAHSDRIFVFEVSHLLTLSVSYNPVCSKLSAGIRPYASNIWYKICESNEVIVINGDCAPCNQVVPG